MKQLVSLLSVFVFTSLFSFTSCKEDKYLDWKYLNQSWYEQQKSVKEDGTDQNYWTETESGLLYHVIYEGIGDNNHTAYPNNKSIINYTYTCKYFNKKNAIISLSYYVSELPQGLQEGVKMMKKNAIYEFIVPQELGYGKDSSTPPPYTTLLFEIKLSDFMTN